MLGVVHSEPPCAHQARPNPFSANGRDGLRVSVGVGHKKRFTTDYLPWPRLVDGVLAARLRIDAVHPPQ